MEISSMLLRNFLLTLFVFLISLSYFVAIWPWLIPVVGFAFVAVVIIDAVSTNSLTIFVRKPRA